jgi:uroporphyrinogen-III synthase
VKIDFRPFIHIEGVNAKEIRLQKLTLITTAIILTSRNAVDHFLE